MGQFNLESTSVLTLIMNSRQQKNALFKPFQLPFDPRMSYTTIQFSKFRHMNSEIYLNFIPKSETRVHASMYVSLFS